MRLYLWLPADDYQYEDIYIALSYRYRGRGYDVGILPLYPERYRESPLGGGRGREIERDPLKSLHVALRLQEIAQPQDTLYTYDFDFLVRSNAGTYAADLVHHAYLALGQYENAIEVLQTIVDGEPTNLLMGRGAAYMAAQGIAHIYSAYLQNLDRALKSYHFIIREYPGVAIGGFEWNTWIDLKAAESILALLSDSPERLGEESLKIVTASADSVVQMIGQQGRLKSMGLLGFYQAMVDSALSVLEKSPSNIRTFFKTDVDFSTALMAEVLTVLLDKGEFDLFYDASAVFADRFAEYEVGDFSLAYPAHVADRTHADLDAVIRRYQAVSDGARFAFYDRVTKRDYTSRVDSLIALSLDTGATLWQLPLTERYYHLPRSIVYQSGRLLLDSAYGVTVVADSVSIAEGGFQEPPRARLAQNYPNPFNAETTIPYNLSRDQHVELVIYNILGQQVRRLIDEIQPPGLYQAAWDGTDSHSKPVSSGVYLYRLRIGNWTQSKRMIILK